MVGKPMLMIRSITNSFILALLCILTSYKYSHNKCFCIVTFDKLKYVNVWNAKKRT